MSANSSGEPKPGEPLSAEAESLLAGVPANLGSESADPEPGTIGADVIDPEEIAGLIPEIDFDEGEVREVLEEGFEWMAGFFQSEHWKLTDRQAKMLARPTAQLASTLYGRLAAFLPGFLARWCEETPGAAGVILVGAWVIGPKIAKQVVVSRSRKTLPRAERQAPQPIRPASAVGPVGEIHDTPPIIDQAE